MKFWKGKLLQFFDFLEMFDLFKYSIMKNAMASWQNVFIWLKSFGQFNDKGLCSGIWIGQKACTHLAKAGFSQGYEIVIWIRVGIGLKVRF